MRGVKWTTNRWDESDKNADRLGIDCRIPDVPLILSSRRLVPVLIGLTANASDWWYLSNPWPNGFWGFRILVHQDLRYERQSRLQFGWLHRCMSYFSCGNIKTGGLNLGAIPFIIQTRFHNPTGFHRNIRGYPVRSRHGTPCHFIRPAPKHLRLPTSGFGWLAGWPGWYFRPWIWTHSRGFSQYPPRTGVVLLWSASPQVSSPKCSPMDSTSPVWLIHPLILGCSNDWWDEPYCSGGLQANGAEPVLFVPKIKASLVRPGWGYRRSITAGSTSRAIV
jgi:hypothetical protein